MKTLKRRSSKGLHRIFISLLLSIGLTWTAQATESDLTVKADPQGLLSSVSSSSQYHLGISRRIVHIVILVERIVTITVLNMVEKGLAQLDSHLQEVEGWLGAKLYQASLNEWASTAC